MNGVERPRSKQKNISTQPIGRELLIYDEARHRAFCLNATSAAVFLRANGLNTIRQIASGATLELAAPVTEDLVVLALEQLQADGLLQEMKEPLVMSDISRRQMVRRVGAGAAMLVPVVAALLAPKAAQAYGGGCVDCAVAQPGVKRDLAVPSPSSSNESSGPTIFNP